MYVLNTDPEPSQSLSKWYINSLSCILCQLVQCKSYIHAAYFCKLYSQIITIIDYNNNDLTYLREVANFSPILYIAYACNGSRFCQHVIIGAAHLCTSAGQNYSSLDGYSMHACIFIKYTCLFLTLSMQLGALLRMMCCMHIYICMQQLIIFSGERAFMHVCMQAGIIRSYQLKLILLATCIHLIVLSYSI